MVEDNMTNALTIEDINQLSNINDGDEIIERFLSLLSRRQQSRQIFIKIDGEDFDGSITGDLAKAIAGIQDNFYRFCAFALYESDNINSLGKDKKDLLLQFKIKSGCTESIADLLRPLRGLIKIALKRMSSKQIFGIIVLIIAAFGAYEGYDRYLSHDEEMKDKEIIEKLIEILGKAYAPLKLKTEQTRTNNIEQIVKYANEANTITYGTLKLDKNDIQRFSQRSDNEKAIVRTFESEFVIFQINNKVPGLIKIQAHDNVSNNDITINVEDDLFQDPSEIDLLWIYAKNRIPVNMQVTESSKRSGNRYRLESIDLKMFSFEK